ncbi:MAG: hypothetical protein HN797_00080 [Tateyamaria sp.]|nr:hypothetical protein [Tateyamaria sp.]
MLDRTAHTTARPLTKRSETSYSNNESVPQVRLGYRPDLRRECLDIAIPVETLTQRLTLSGAPTTARALGLPTDFYCEAVSHAHEMRNRFSFADIADQTGQLTHLVSQEI